MKLISKITDTTHELFLKWVLINVTVTFALVAAGYHGLLHKLYLNDPSHLTILITVIYLFTTIYCGIRTWSVSKQQKLLKNFIRKFNDDTIDLSETDGIVYSHMNDIAESGTDNQTILLTCRANDLHDKHEIIHYCADVLLKLGLLGTVIGFILALWPLYMLDEFTFEAVKGQLGTISGGIGVALLTTFAGIVTNIVVGLQAHFLETGTNQLMTRLAHLTETKLIPLLRKENTRSMAP